MKIVHCIRTLNLAAGGPPMIAACLSAAQAARGHDVHLVSVEDGDTRELASQVPGLEKVTLHTLPTGRFASVRRMGLVSLQTKRLLVGTDFAHFHSVWDSILVEAGRVCRSLRIPYFVLLNGMLDPWSLSQSRFKKMIAMSVIHRRHLNGAAALHVGNSDEEKLIAPLGLTATSVMFPNGVFIESIRRPLAGSAFSDRVPGLRAGEPFVLFLSRLHYKKGLDVLADAFGQAAARMPGVKLVVAGPDGGARAGFEEAIGGKGLSDRVLLAGPLYGDDKHAALLAADCFCLPSRQEGFSVAITESLAYGKPTVVTEGCHYPAVATSGAGRVVPLDPAAVADAMVEIMTDAALRARMSAAGKTYAESHLAWSAIAGQTLAAYEKVIAEGALNR